MSEACPVCGRDHARLAVVHCPLPRAFTGAEVMAAARGEAGLPAWVREAESRAQAEYVGVLAEDPRARARMEGRGMAWWQDLRSLVWPVVFYAAVLATVAYAAWVLS